MKPLDDADAQKAQVQTGIVNSAAAGFTGLITVFALSIALGGVWGYNQILNFLLSVFGASWKYLLMGVFLLAILIGILDTLREHSERVSAILGNRALLFGAGLVGIIIMSLAIHGSKMDLSIDKAPLVIDGQEITAPVVESNKDEPATTPVVVPAPEQELGGIIGGAY